MFQKPSPVQNQCKNIQYNKCIKYFYTERTEERVRWSDPRRIRASQLPQEEEVLHSLNYKTIPNSSQTSARVFIRSQVQKDFPIIRVCNFFESLLTFLLFGFATFSSPCWSLFFINTNQNSKKVFFWILWRFLSCSGNSLSFFFLQISSVFLVKFNTSKY